MFINFIAPADFTQFNTKMFKFSIFTTRKCLRIFPSARFSWAKWLKKRSNIAMNLIETIRKQTSTKRNILRIHDSLELSLIMWIQILSSVCVVYFCRKYLFPSFVWHIKWEKRHTFQITKLRFRTMKPHSKIAAWTVNG